MTCQTYVVDIIKNISWFPGELWTIAWKGNVLKVAKQKPHMVQKFPDIKGVGGQKRNREMSHVCELWLLLKIEYWPRCSINLAHPQSF